MAGEVEKPPRVKPRLVSAPKIRGLYYCDFWRDAQLPEFWKTRPVVVVSFKNTLTGPCTVIPTSTVPQEGESAKWAHQFSVQFDGVQSWAVCNHPTTVATSRLSQFKGGIVRVPEVDFDAILRLLLRWLPVPRPVGDE
jgi:mRNA interferase MazF